MLFAARGERRVSISPRLGGRVRKRPRSMRLIRRDPARSLFWLLSTHYYTYPTRQICDHNQGLCTDIVAVQVK